MLKKLNCAALALAALTAGFLATTALPAYADQANINSISFSTESISNQVVHVVSTDKQKWDKFKSGSVLFSGNMQIDTKWPGFVWAVAVKLGQCGKYTCGSHPTLFADQNVKQRDYSHQQNFAVQTSQLHTSTGGISVVPYGDQIIATCNQHLSADGPTKAHSFYYEMTAAFGADTGKKVGNLDRIPSEVPDVTDPDINEFDYVAFGKFKVKVMCDPVVKSPAGDIAAEQPKNLSVTAIDLFRTTYSHATSQPNPGTVCKKARWLVRLNTNKAGPVKFKLWTKNGDAPMTSKIVDAWAAFDGNSKYQAEYTEWTEVTKTSVVQAMAEDETNPIGQSTGWKDITLHCTGAGGGGLAGTPGNSNPDNGTMPNTLKVTGELSLADQAGAPKDKPRLGQAVFKIWASKPGNTSYKLTCSGGRNWEGTLPTAKVADGKYQAVGAQNFQIDKTEQIGCALRSTSLPKDDVIALDTKMFELVKRNVDLGGPNNIVNLPKPQTDAPQRPARPSVNIAPTPKISCAGRTVRSNACFCPPGSNKVHAGQNAYRCMTRMVRPERVAPPAAHKPTPNQTRRLRHRLQSAEAGGN